jgi:hypothetical protein
MVPQADPVHPDPLTPHSTVLLLLPVTVALNCCSPVGATTALVGEIATTTGAMSVTVAEPDFVLSATEVAFTVTCAGLGMLPGAV